MISRNVPASLLGRLNRLTSIASGHSEIVAALFVLAVIFMMVLPLPTWLIDILIALNICIAALLVIFSMYLPAPLAFSTFPGVLLLTTLFRLALSISTTRLILLQADAGNIVQAFGEFVVGGDLVVGLVIFLILTVVQFVVITKGSERIAEVGARFSLDAMPGKQLAIDSDLRAGLLTADQASARRDELSRENQMYGAMDGAMKFVKGDAIAGLVIVFVNLLGGLAIGTLKHGMSTGDAVTIYSVLTIGDGLVAQIPALLISLTAGMIVTRVSTTATSIEANVGKDIANQILSQPKAWLMASGAMTCFAVIPGMPTIAFFILAIITGLIGFTRLRMFQRLEQQQIDDSKPVDLDEKARAGQEDVKAFLAVTPLMLKLSGEFSNKESSELLLAHVRRTRNLIVTRLGILLPVIEIEIDPNLKPNEYQLLINDVPVLTGIYISQCIVVEGEESVIEGLVRGNYSSQKLGNGENSRQANWVSLEYLDVIESAGLQAESGDVFLVRLIETVILKRGVQFFGIEESHKLATWLVREYPELAKEVERSVPMLLLTDIMQRLLTERVSIRSFRLIAAALIEKVNITKDPNLLTEHVRMALRDQICFEFSSSGQLTVVSIAKPLISELDKAHKNLKKTGQLILPQAIREQFIKELSDVLTAYRNENLLKSKDNFTHIEGLDVFGETAIALIVPGELRIFIRKLLENNFFTLPVLSYSEVDPDIAVTNLGEIGVKIKLSNHAPLRGGVTRAHDNSDGDTDSAPLANGKLGA